MVSNGTLTLTLGQYEQADVVLLLTIKLVRICCPLIHRTGDRLMVTQTTAVTVSVVRLTFQISTYCHSNMSWNVKHVEC